LKETFDATDSAPPAARETGHSSHHHAPPRGGGGGLAVIGVTTMVFGRQIAGSEADAAPQATPSAQADTTGVTVGWWPRCRCRSRARLRPPAR
jgi:hypothetical protein